MKRFAYKLIFFLMPLLIIGILMEVMLRQMPNAYSYKKCHLDANSNKIEILFLGNSHSFFGLNPEYTKQNSYNAGYVSQSLNYDLEILKKYENNWSGLKYIVLPVSYFSLFEKLESSKEPWRVKNYCIYYKIRSSKYLPNYTEMLNSPLKLNIRRLYNFYYKKADNISCTESGWGTSYKTKKSGNLIDEGKSAAKRHRRANDQYFEEMTLVLNSIINFSGKYKIDLILFTPPAFESYKENLDQGQLNRTVDTIVSIVENHKNCFYYNFLEDKSFTGADFYDPDHLDEIGAKKLTLKIDSIIHSREN